ncbi:MAG: Type 1 glutamine amidotransferase-like domain-containing protein [Bdellovibrio sp.]|nr:Type 1 glutamine amidotransferase-like domain-containing protein [Bdellovibrio sp.]
MVLYSGGMPKENRALDLELLKLIKHKHPSITFIPASSFDAETEFRYFVNHYRRFKVSKFLLLPVDRPIDRTMLELAFKSDIIHLGGGNTYYFLNALRKAGLIPRLQRYVRQGGILAGESAGGIIMTPSIFLAGHPPFDADENYVHLTNLKSLALVPFEFFPHYKKTLRYEKAFITYTRKHKRPLFACPDGAGLVIDDVGLKILGRVTCFCRGQKITLT